MSLQVIIFFSFWKNKKIYFGEKLFLGRGGKTETLERSGNATPRLYPRTGFIQSRNWDTSIGTMVFNFFYECSFLLRTGLLLRRCRRWSRGLCLVPLLCHVLRHAEWAYEFAQTRNDFARGLVVVVPSVAFDALHTVFVILFGCFWLWFTRHVYHQKV
jgi:hypothetical protein